MLSTSRIQWCLAGAVLVGASFLLGCNRTPKLPVEQGVIVKAKILKGGQPLKAQDDSGIPGYELIQPYQISLVPVGGSEGHQRGEYVGIYDQTGLVTFLGAGKGVPPGVYKLVIVGSGAMPDAEGSEDPLGGRFNRQNTPLQFTITVANVGKEQDLGTIDLDNPPK
ncbi:MAG: hypothetical protein KatS3mg109_0892 [Pirellulaceae bacterium]|nr:MAG: hypothetical protein KatS3mg109_0892 [Pirellulaceae bacterium]GIW94483.1 MAG: hypothetical protein KatS3mg110_2524 [Pirellulaceae bacterium]